MSGAVFRSGSWWKLAPQSACVRTCVVPLPRVEKKKGSWGFDLRLAQCLFHLILVRKPPPAQRTMFGTAVRTLQVGHAKHEHGKSAFIKILTKEFIINFCYLLLHLFPNWQEKFELILILISQFQVFLAKLAHSNFQPFWPDVDLFLTPNTRWTKF